MKRLTLLTLCLLCPLVSMHLRAQDAEGCKDSPLIARMNWSTIHSCESKRMQQLDVIVGEQDGEEQKKSVAGEYHHLEYVTHKGVSIVQVYRSMEQALRNRGFEIIYEDPMDYIAASKGATWVIIENKGASYSQTVLIEQPASNQGAAGAPSAHN